MTARGDIARVLVSGNGLHWHKLVMDVSSLNRGNERKANACPSGETGTSVVVDLRAERINSPSASGRILTTLYMDVHRQQVALDILRL